MWNWGQRDSVHARPSDRDGVGTGVSGMQEVPCRRMSWEVPPVDSGSVQSLRLRKLLYFGPFCLPSMVLLVPRTLFPAFWLLPCPSLAGYEKSKHPQIIVPWFGFSLQCLHCCWSDLFKSDPCLAGPSTLDLLLVQKAQWPSGLLQSSWGRCTYLYMSISVWVSNTIWCY